MISTTRILKDDFENLKNFVIGIKEKDRIDQIGRVVFAVMRMFNLLGMAFGATLTLAAFSFRPLFGVFLGIAGLSTVVFNHDLFIGLRNYSAELPPYTKTIFVSPGVKKVDMHDVSVEMPKRIVKGTILAPFWLKSYDFVGKFLAT